jgi:hypothetical protein
MSSKVEGITPEELDRLVDEGKENVLQYFDLDNLRRGDSKRINLDLPIGFLTALDREALRESGPCERQQLYDDAEHGWIWSRPPSELHFDASNSDIAYADTVQFLSGR